MASHGGSRHWKRMAVPGLLSRERKRAVWVTKPAPGRHAREESLALVTLLRDVLRVAEDASQARKLLQSGLVLVDGKPARDKKLAVGLMDLVSIPSLDAHYRLVVRGGKLLPLAVPKDQVKVKLCKVVGKTFVPGSKVQLNLHDGRSQLIEREEDRFAPGDTVRLAVPAQKIEGFVKLERGARCYVFRGRHSGTLATLEEVLERKGSRESDARLRGADGKDLITVKGYLFAVDPDFKLQ